MLGLFVKFVLGEIFRRECIHAFRSGCKSPGVIEPQKRCVLRRERIYAFRNVD